MKTRKWILLFVSLNLLALIFTRTANGQDTFIYAPGTTNFPGLPVEPQIPAWAFNITESAYSTAQSVAAASANFVSGDYVLLLDSSSNTNISNWAAVVTFFNPSDPNFTQGLAATEDEAFFPVNGANTFADFTLAPNTVYLPVSTFYPISFNPDGSITEQWL